MSTKVLAAMFFGLFLSSLTFASDQPSDTYAERFSAATRYAKVADVRKMMSDTVVEAARQAPESNRKKIVDFLNANINMTYVENAVIAVMTKHFTADELNALAEFYGSVRGKSILAKFGPYMGDMMPIMQSEMVRVIEQAKKENL
jgi:hypothetical protein